MTTEHTITMDATGYTVVAICDCGWRAANTSRARAWRESAAHLRIDHGDPIGAARAGKAAKEARRRERDELASLVPVAPAPESRNRGNQGHARKARRRASTDPGA